MNRILLLLMVLVSITGAGCHSAPVKHYSVQGEVISVDAPRKLITLKHGDIPGLMPAMTMQYAVADARQIASLQPGDRITADLVVSEDIGHLEKITLVSKGTGKPSDGTSQRIPEKGEAVPDFALVNQDGKPVHLHDFQGKALLVTFIYTRCPLPDFCPRMNQNFLEIQNLLQRKPNVLGHAAFLSISFDPEHDTPAVLKHYAAIYRKTSKAQQAFDWQFAAPSTKDLPEIAHFFGLVTQPDQAQIVHSLSTTLIAPDGKVQEWYGGNDWKPADVTQALELALPRT